MHSSYMDLTSDDGFTFPAWVARPDGPPQGGVVVLQEIFGVNAHIRAVADRLAARGYLAVAPDLFARVRPGVELGYGPADLEEGRALKVRAEGLPGAGVLPDIGAAADAALAQGATRVAVVGFCWGGLWAWRSACALPGLSAAVCYYAGGITTADEMARQPRCPVMAHFGRLDPWIALEGVQAFARAHPEVQTHVYEADHGFNCDQRASYDEAAAMAARDRTLGFLARHLG